MTSPPSIQIVVLNWNGLADTLACLDSLRRIRYDHCRIVVVDNGSSDGSAEALSREASSREIELIAARRNHGYAGGNNLGIRHALDGNAEFVLVLNNDTTVDPSLLDELVAAARRHPEAGCFGPWIFYMSDSDRLWFSRSEWSTEAAAFTAPDKGRLSAEVSRERVDTQYVCGAALFFRTEVARHIGLFDERFFLVYEDADWCFRARRAGFGCIMVPTARVWHKIGTSFGSESSPLRTYFSVRNKLLFAERNLPGAEWRRILGTAVRRLLPSARLDVHAAGSINRALRWAANDYVRDGSRKLGDPQEAAHRRGVLDYLCRRFGDCPPKIRVLTRGWADQETTAAPGRLAR